MQYKVHSPITHLFSLNSVLRLYCANRCKVKACINGVCPPLQAPGTSPAESALPPINSVPKSIYPVLHPHALRSRQTFAQLDRLAVELSECLGQGGRLSPPWRDVRSLPGGHAHREASSAVRSHARWGARAVLLLAAASYLGEAAGRLK